MDEDPSSSDFVPIPQELIELVRPELEPCERLLWAGEPGLRLRKQPAGSRSGAIVWAVGSFSWASVAWPDCRSRWFRWGTVSTRSCCLSAAERPLIGVLVAIGIIASLVSGRSQGQNLTGYLFALTDRRAIIWIAEFRSMGLTVHSYDRNTIKRDQLHRVKYPDGSGDVVFLKGDDRATGFLDVADVRRVENLVRRYLVALDPTSNG